MTDSMTVHETCVKLFGIGDYFQMARLTSAAYEALKKHNRLQGAAYQRAVIRSRREHRDSEEVVEFFDSDYHDRFFKQAKAVYDVDSASWTPIRDAFFHFFECTRYFVLQDIDIHDHLAEVPRLALLILQRLEPMRDTSRIAFLSFVLTARRKFWKLLTRPMVSSLTLGLRKTLTRAVTANTLVENATNATGIQTIV